MTEPSGVPSRMERCRHFVPPYTCHDEERAWREKGHGVFSDHCVHCKTNPPSGVPSMEDVLAVEPLCELMHDAYEKAAVGAGWETNPASRKPWSDVPEANKATMRAAVSALVEHVTAGLASVLAEARAEALEQAADERAARKIAGDAADRFRDVLSEVLGLDENPGDDALVATIRERHGKTGPEPTRWRDFCTSALAHLDQINASDDHERSTRARRSVPESEGR